MSLRTKALLSIVFLLLVLTGLLAVVTRQMLIAGAVRLEDEALRQDIDQVQAALGAEETHLMANATLWAQRDATGVFIQGGSPQVVEGDMPLHTLTTMSAAFVAYLDAQNTVLLSRLLDSATDQPLPVPEGFAEALSTAANAAGYAQISYVQMPQGVASVAFAPIPAPDGGSAGTLALGRFMDVTLLQHIADTAHLSVELTTLSNPAALPASIQVALAQMSVQQPRTIRKDADGYAYGYMLLHSADGQPLAVLDVRLSRRLFQQNSTAAWTLLLTFILGGMAGALTVLLLLNAHVLRRINHLTARLLARQEGQSIGTVSTDEIGQMTAAINQVFATLDEQQQQRMVHVQQLEQRVQMLSDARTREGRFFKQAAGEFRAPLSNLTTRLYLLSKTPDRLSEHLLVLNAMAAHTRALVDDVFDLARLDDGELPLAMTAVCLQDVLTELTARRKSAGLSTLLLDQLPAEPVLVRLDTTRFVQALDHLIQFAYEWSAPEHPIRLSMLARDTSTVQVRLRIERLGKHGVNPIDIFRPFAYSTEHGTTNTGLGMALAQGIVRAHRGELRYEMRDNGGQFTLELTRATVTDSRPLETSRTR